MHRRATIAGILGGSIEAGFPLFAEARHLAGPALKLPASLERFSVPLPTNTPYVRHRMKAEELRALQAPQKERYREASETARITLSARARLGDNLSCRVETGKALVTAGLHPGTGGTGHGACSGDMLLEALVACAGVTLNAVATALSIELRDAVVKAEGDLDFRGTLGLSKEVPVGLQNIRLQFTLDTDASEEQIATLVRLTERYCVVYQTLAHSPKLALAVSRRPA
jgi:uncharacterized OsmC-like protein